MPSYRQLEAPVAINTNLPSRDASRNASIQIDAATRLADSIASFGGAVNQVAGEFAAKKGLQEGAAAGASGTPELKKGLASLTMYGRAYNNAAYREYAVVADSQVEDAAAQAEINANGDPAKYAAVMAAARDKAAKEAQPELRTMLTQAYNQRIANGSRRLAVQQATAQKDRNRQVVSEGIARSTDRVANGYASNDPREYENALIEQEKLTMLMDSAVTDGTITPIEREALQQTTQRSITKQTVSAKFSQELQNPYGDPVKFIKNLKESNKTSEALLPDEEEKLVSSLLQELHQHNSLEAAGETASINAQKARWAAGERLVSVEYLRGRLRPSELARMAEEGDLDPGLAVSLGNMMRERTQGPGADDPRVKLDVRANLLKYSEREILEMPGLTDETRGDMLEKRRKDAAGWRATPKAAAAEDKIAWALGIPKGVPSYALTDTQKMQQNLALNEWYDDIEALPAAEREVAVVPKALEVIRKYVKEGAASKAAEQERLKAGYIAGQPDPEDMDEENAKVYQETLKGYDERIRKFLEEAARN